VCGFCGKLTPGPQLAAYGARCARCYAAYCESPPQAPDWMADKRTDGPKAWAQVLKAREQRGERLSPAQRDMWRWSLGPGADSEGGEA
jgi:hypothetical protein